jgi:hypothetical protein
LARADPGQALISELGSLFYWCCRVKVGGLTCCVGGGRAAEVGVFAAAGEFLRAIFCQVFRFRHGVLLDANMSVTPVDSFGRRPRVVPLHG